MRLFSSIRKVQLLSFLFQKPIIFMTVTLFRSQSNSNNVWNHVTHCLLLKWLLEHTDSLHFWKEFDNKTVWKSKLLSDFKITLSHHHRHSNHYSLPFLLRTYYRLFFYQLHSVLFVDYLLRIDTKTETKVWWKATEQQATSLLTNRSVS